MGKESKKNEIDVSKIDLEKEREKTTETPGVLPYAHTVGSAVVKATDKGKIKGRAMATMQEQTQKQMSQIYEQIQLLARQAEDIKKRVAISERIYLAEIPFEPLVGNVYYFYQKDEETDVLSLIGPKEWGRSFKFQGYLATVKLMSDHTWEILDKGEDF
ncbi:DUF2452 domain-containing protein [Flexithrix dorotheae]|uniref:DUF2452 domain-containing protein n=1 Tax=Flexithrix dorotheae TaxID=70993 RepID=UPI000364AE2F|nr:DUF2452 domain-containing protein [Flexithrix dorotheae]